MHSVTLNVSGSIYCTEMETHCLVGLEMRNRQDIEQQLRTDLIQARRRFESATAEMTAEMKDIALSAGLERRVATVALREALRRWNDFVIDGKVPRDFQSELQAQWLTYK